jgi:hypothetical protein
MLISQTVSPLHTPSMREAMLFGGTRREWEELLDQAPGYRHDEAVLRALEGEARREELRRARERKLIHCAPMPAAAAIARPNVFRTAFQKNIGGVSGESDVWWDGSYVAIDGGGKVSDAIDYIDNAHTLRQASMGALQVAAPVADAAMANALSLPFVGTQVYQSTRAASLFSYLNNTPSRIIVCAKPTSATGVQIILETWPGSSISAVSMSANTTTLNAAIYRATGGGQSASIVSGWIAGTAKIYSAAWDTTASPQARLRASGMTDGTLATITGATGTATLTFTFGARNGPSLFLSANVRAIYLFHGLTTAAEAVVYARIQADTGLTA